MSKSAKYCKKCCVSNCKDGSCHRHRFPINNEKQCKIWVDRVGNPIIAGYDRKTLYNTCFICSKHFIENCLNGCYLVRNSLPTINMPGLTGEARIGTSFVHALKHHAGEEPCATAAHQAMPIENIPTTITLPKQPQQLKRHAKRIYQLLQEVNLTRQKQLSGNEKILYRAARNSMKQAYKSSQRVVSMQERLRAAKKLSESVIYKKVHNSVSDVIYKFLLSQVKQYKKRTVPSPAEKGGGLCAALVILPRRKVVSL